MIDEDIRNQTHICRDLSNDISFRYFSDAFQAESTIIILFIAREIVEFERLLKIELGQVWNILAFPVCADEIIVIEPLSESMYSLVFNIDCRVH